MTVSGNSCGRFTRLLAALCFAFCAAALALPARSEPAGQVLSATGDVLVLRGSQILRLQRGAAVESGDQIHTAADANVLVLFTDSGLVWIRSNSDFIIDEYSYAQDRESAFFSLLKGGLRSVTGLVGRRNRANYRLRVSVASIGIRGTDFSVVMCQRDCRDSDGSAAANGLYGEVIEGRIAVSPFEDKALEREFGAGEFFHLADEHSIPTPLFLPPPFLRNKLDEQARFMERTGIVVAPGSPGVTPDPAPILSSGPGTATDGNLTEALPAPISTLPLVGSPAVTPITQPVLNLVGSAVTQVTQPVVNLLGSPAVAPITQPVLNLVGSAVTPITQPVLNLVGSAITPITQPVVNLVGSPAVTPIAAPIAPPIASPVVIPIEAPIALPIASPVVIPIAAPIAPPIASPVVIPIAAPIALPIASPVVIPIAAPIAPPVPLPGGISTGLPSGLPTSPIFKR